MAATQRPDEKLAEEVGERSSLVRAVAFGRLARAQARIVGGGDTKKAVDGWNEEHRPLGYSGLAMGLRDKASR